MTRYDYSSLSGAIVLALVATWTVISIFATTQGGIILGGGLALVTAVILFYGLFRLDKWAKGL